VIIDAVGVPWAILGLGATVAAIASALYVDDRRSRAPRAVAATATTGSA
jgi:hypothetical protein